MLRTLKQFASSWLAQLLLGLLVISFAVWGIADVFRGYGSGAAVTVGEAEVSVRDYQLRYEATFNVLQRQFGTALTQQQAAQMGVPTQVLSVLVAEATLDDVADGMGLGMSNDTLSRRITTDPNLTGPTGVYSEAALQQIVRAQGMTLDEFVIDRRDEYVRRQITDALAGGLTVPDVYMRAFEEYRNESRTLSYVVVAADPLDPIPEPSETELEAYFAEQTADYRAPAYRGFRYFVLSLDAITRPQDVAAEEIAKRYDTYIDRFTTPARRRIEQIVFDTPEEAADAAAKLSSGTTFADLAALLGLTADDTAFGTFARDQIADAAIAEAAFALEAGGTSGVVDGRFGPAIVHVPEIIEGSVRPLSEVEDEIRDEIAAEAASGEIDDLHDVIEDARAGGSGLDEVAARYGLEMKTVAAADAAGNDEDGNPIDLPEQSGLLRAVYESDVGLENDPLRYDGRNYIWYEIASVTAPRDRQLDEVRDEVAAAWTDDQRAERAEEAATAVADRLEAGDSFETVAEAQSLMLDTAEAVARATPPEGDLTAAAVAAAFDGPEGHVAILPGSDPLTRVVLRVDAVETPTFFSGAPGTERVEQALSRQIQVDLMQLYVTEAQNDREVRFNQEVLNLLFASTSGADRLQ